MVPVSTFAVGSHGEFNENTHAFIQNVQWRQQKGAIKNDSLDGYDLFLVSLLVSKRKRPEA